jgi:PDDEXK-like domain of unknown function (DUF3799)
MTAVALEPGVYELTDEEYFGPELAGTTLSSTGARELLKPGGPARFRHAIDNGTLEVRREFDIGHAVHTLVLGAGPEPWRIDAEEWRAKAVKDEVAAVRAMGGVPLRPSDFAAAHAMAKAVKAHPLAAKLLRNGQPERTLIWRDPATGVMCRAKADWLREDGIVDLKTCESAAPDALSKSAHNFGYAIQAPFYLRGHRSESWRFMNPYGPVEPFFVHIAVEKTPPYLVHVNQLTERAMAWGDRQVSQALEIFRDCQESGEWPGYPTDEITDIDLPAWVRTEEW